VSICSDTQLVST